MSSLDRKRKATGDHHHRQPHKSPRPLPSHSSGVETTPGLDSLPPLPVIDDKYIDVVFTHPSSETASGSSYDRLEFLGDAYIEVIATQLIFDRLAHLPAGRMSQVRESLVKNESIGQYTVLYGLDKRLKQYKKIQNESKPAAWLKIKGDIFEAYVAAVVLSTQGGFATARTWLAQLWGPKLEAVSAKPEAPTKSKEELAKKILVPGVKLSYEDEREPIVHYGKGIETYFVGVYLTGLGWENQFLGSGKGLSRPAAGQTAAAAALDNHPFIDEVIAKRNAFVVEKQRREEASQRDREG